MSRLPAFPALAAPPPRPLHPPGAGDGIQCPGSWLSPTGSPCSLQGPRSPVSHSPPSLVLGLEWDRLIPHSDPSSLPPTQVLVQAAAAMEGMVGPPFQAHCILKLKGDGECMGFQPGVFLHLVLVQKPSGAPTSPLVLGEVSGCAGEAARRYGGQPVAGMGEVRSCAGEMWGQGWGFSWGG